MTDAERRAIDEAVARLVDDAPPVPDEVLDMLRRDRCPIGAKARERAA